jgi:hypothetical protein
MESVEKNHQETADQIYQFAANLLVNQGKSEDETKSELIAQGLDSQTASTVVENIQTQIHSAKKERAKKDMLYGALWCVGGIVATAANIGFIFWGAILFGGIQFFKGVINS